jgi:oligopeptide transport system permease protein
LPGDGVAPDIGKETRVPYDKLPNCDKLLQGIPSDKATDPNPVEITEGWQLLRTVTEHYQDRVEVGQGATLRQVPCDRTRTVLYSDLTRSQFLEYMNNLLRLDFGVSLATQTRGQAVFQDIILKRMPPSALLGILSTIISFMFGIPLGVMTAVYQNKLPDYLGTFFATAIIGIPSFVLGPLLLLLVVATWHLLPGPTTLVWKNPNLLSGEFWSRAVLPILILGVSGSAGLARLTRATMLQVLQDDYIRTARSKGMRERGVLYIHTLRNALIPIATLMGPLLAGVLLGSLFIEKVYAIPGLGDTFLTSISTRDYNLVVGGAVIYSTLLILGNILVDVMYTWLDPRIRYS